MGVIRVPGQICWPSNCLIWIVAQGQVLHGGVGRNLKGRGVRLSASSPRLWVGRGPHAARQLPKRPSMPSTRACSGPPRTGVLRGARCSFGPLYRELRSSSDLDHSQTIALLDAVSNILAWNASSIGRPGPDQQHEVGDAHRPRNGRRKQLSLGCPGIFLSGLPLSSWCLEMLREVQQPPWSQLCRSSSSPICRERRALCAATIGATITRAIFRL